MTLLYLLSLFAPFDNGVTLRVDPQDALGIVSQLPTASEDYVRVAEEGFDRLQRDPSDVNDLEFERLIRVLRFLLYVDGRSQDALLRIADLAYDYPHVSFAGSNALAGLVSYLEMNDDNPSEREKLVGVFEKLMTDPNLFHNARECRNAVLRR